MGGCPGSTTPMGMGTKAGMLRGTNSNPSSMTASGTTEGRRSPAGRAMFSKCGLTRGSPTVGGNGMIISEGNCAVSRSFFNRTVATMPRVKTTRDSMMTSALVLESGMCGISKASMDRLPGGAAMRTFLGGVVMSANIGIAIGSNRGMLRKASIMGKKTAVILSCRKGASMACAIITDSSGRLGTSCCRIEKARLRIPCARGGPAAMGRLGTDLAMTSATAISMMGTKGRLTSGSTMTSKVALHVATRSKAAGRCTVGRGGRCG